MDISKIKVGDVVYNIKDATARNSSSSAESSNKLTDSEGNISKGSSTKGVYFNDGVPVEMEYSLNKDVPSNAVFTDTTYESLTETENGTSVSLVTTGEKYIWNHKANSGDFAKTVCDLSSAPTNSTTVDNNGNSFMPGDIVRVEDENSDSGYSFYRLHCIDESGNAIWAKLDSDNIDNSSTVTVIINTNQSNTNDINGANITLSYDSVNITKTYNGSNLAFSVPANKQYSITFGEVLNYSTPNTISGSTTDTISSYSHNVSYNTEIVTVTTSQSDVTLYINDVAYEGPTKIAYGTEYTVTGSAVSGYTVSSVTYTAEQSSRTVVVVYEEVRSGVFAITSSGTEVAYSSIDQTNTGQYVGVVVRDSDKGIAFFIDKRFPTGSSANASTGNYKAWSSALYNKDQSYLTNITGSNGTGSSIEGAANSSLRTAAFTDFAAGKTGVENTNNIVNDSTCSSETAQNNAAKYCRSIQNPVTGNYDGYLGSLAEWIVVNDNQVEINNTLLAIGGVKFEVATSGNSSYTLWWTSSECSSNDAWYWYWTSSDSFANFRNTNKNSAAQFCCARPFFPL